MEKTTSDLPGTADGPGGELDRLILMPALTLAALIVVLCATVSFRLPVHGAVVPVECLLAAFLVAVYWRWHRSRSARPLVLIGLLATFAAWLALADYAGKWLPTGADIIGSHPDSWSYQALADYLDHYHRGRTDGMPMVDEFGAHLKDSRFAAPSLLAFLHDLPLLADIPTTRVTFSLLCLGVHFFSVLALGRACIGYTGWQMPLLAAFLATAGGWFGRVLMEANNDNLIFAALTPALIAMCCVPRAENLPDVRWRVVAAIGLLFGATLYSYPEGLALLGVLCLPLVAALAWRGADGRFQSRRWVEIGGGGFVGLVLAVPYLPTFVAHLHHQIAFGQTVSAVLRPGEGSLPGLLGGNRLAGAFALGDEMLAAPTHLADNLVPLCLLVLVILGAGFIARHQRWFPWVILPLTGLCLWQNVSKHYDYGTFKVLLVASWWIYPAISAGLFWIVERFALSAIWKIALMATLLFGVGAVKSRNRLSLPPVMLADRLLALQELSTIRFVTGQAPVLLVLDDDFDHLWATYYLRELPLGTRQQKGYLAMPHIAPFLASGIRPPPETCPYLLVTGSRPGALWQNSRFSLVRATPVYLEGIQNPPNGLEMVGERRFLWIGTQPATVRIFAQKEGKYQLSAARFDLGPSLGGKRCVQVAITDAGGTRTVDITAGTISIPLTLAAGDNSVILRCLDTPKPGPYNGDNRELMLGILGPDVALAASPGQ